MRPLDDFDLSELRSMWQRRRQAAGPIRSRVRPEGMTRPTRSPEEWAWLQQRGEYSPFVEVEPAVVANEAAEPHG